MDGVMTGPRKMVSVGREGVGVSESSDGSPSVITTRLTI